MRSAKKISKTIIAILIGSVLLLAASFYIRSSYDIIFTETKAPPTYSGYLLAGQVASFHQDTPKAIDYFKQALKLQPDEIELKRDILINSLSSNSFKEAVNIAPSLIDDEQVGIWSKFTMALSAIKEDKYSLAKSYLKVSNNMSPMEKEIIKIVDVWATFGEDGYDKAIKELFSHPMEKWNKFITYTQAFYLAQLSGKNEEALKYHKLLTETVDQVTENSYLRASSNYALMLGKNKKYDAALHFLSNIPNIEGNLLYTRLYSALAQHQNLPLIVNNIEEALSEFFVTMVDLLEKLNVKLLPSIYNSFTLGLNPRNSLSLLYTGTITRYNNVERSLYFFDKVPESDLYYPDAQLEKAFTLSLLKRPKEALSVIDNLEEEYPFLIDLLFLKAQIYIEDKEYPLALIILDDYFNRIKKISSGDWKLYYKRATIYQQLKDYAKMNEDYKKALELAPNDPALLSEYSQALLEAKMLPRYALTLAKKAYNIQPYNSETVATIGGIYYLLQDYKQAQKYLEEAIIISPENATAQIQLGDLYWKLNKKHAALYQWKQASTKEMSVELQKLLNEKIKKAEKELN